MKYEELIEIIEEIAPPHLTEDWDNSGLQIRTEKEDVGSVLVALEMDEKVIAEAEKKRAELIITHHPLFFDPLSGIDETDQGSGAMTGRLLRQGIGVYSAHLTFDNAPRGNNAYLASLLGLKDARRPEDLPETIPFWMGTWPRRSGEESTTLQTVGQEVEEVLGLPESTMRMVGEMTYSIRRVAICTGAGGDFVELAAERGCDLLITGDVKYHQARRARELGLAVIDAGHYGTEKIFVPNFAAQLREKAGDDLVINESSIDLDPFTRR